jgi:hypothetical protein
LHCRPAVGWLGVLFSEEITRRQNARLTCIKIAAAPAWFHAVRTIGEPP